MLTVYKQITIQTLYQQGEKKTRIAAHLGCHRNTVRNVLQRGRVIEKQTRDKPSCFDPYKQQIREWLDKEITYLRIHEMLREEYEITRSYDNLCRYIRQHFPKPVVAYGVQNTSPGEEAEIDFGYLGLLPDFSGKLVKAWGLAVILAYSRLGYWVVVYDQQLATLVKQLKLVFEFFGGVPKRLKVDNMRAAILRNQHYDLEYNQDFLEFARHYQTVITPCVPYHPEQKGKVEAAIKYLQANFVNGRQFNDGGDLARKLKDWMVNHANLRVHGTTKKVPWEVFQKEEKAKLQPLPPEEFAFFQRGIRQVWKNCHIHFENNYYSVPSLLAGKEVTIRWSDHLVRVIYQGEQVALHHRAKGSGEYITVRSHLPDYKIYSATEYQARYEQRMAQIGGNAHQYFEQLLLAGGHWSRIVRGILGLVKEYGEEAVEASMKRALCFKVTDLVTIKHIIKKRLYEIEPEPKLPIVSPSIETGDGLARDLSYYSVP